MVQQIVVSPCHQTEVPGQNLHLLKLQPKEGGIKLKKMKEQKKVKTNTFIHNKKIYIKTLYFRYCEVYAQWQAPDAKQERSINTW